jgi:hypothetical protein
MPNIRSEDFSLTKHRLNCYMDRIYNKDKHAMFKFYRYRKGILLNNLFKKRRRILNIRERRFFIYKTKQRKDKTGYMFRDKGIISVYYGVLGLHMTKIISKPKTYSVYCR